VERASFTQAVLILRDKLEWEKKGDQRSAKARLTELGIRPSAHASQADKDAELDAKIKLARDFIENGPQGQRRRYKEQQARWDAEHVTLYFKNGRVDHAGSETARNEAIAAHQAADVAAENQSALQIIVPNKLFILSLNVRLAEPAAKCRTGSLNSYRLRRLIFLRHGAPCARWTILLYRGNQFRIKVRFIH
jgi:hypothetical protein